MSGRKAAKPESLVVGRRPALEAVRSGAARELLVASSARSTEGLRDLLRAAEAGGVAVRRVSTEKIDGMARGTRHQGVAARVSLPRELREADLSAREWSREAVVVVLDGVTDPRNVGAVARTAEAAGASAMVVRERRGTGLTPTALRASAGALLHLPVVRVANIRRALERLKDEGFRVFGFDASAGQTIDEAEPPKGRVAIVLGSEGAGLGRLVGEGCDELVAIPLRGRVDSLNVSAAAAVALYWFVPGRGTFEGGGRRTGVGHSGD